MKITNYKIHFTNGNVLSITDGVQHGTYPERMEFTFTGNAGKSYIIPKINVCYIEEYKTETNIMP